MSAMPAVEADDDDSEIAGSGTADKEYFGAMNRNPEGGDKIPHDVVDLSRLPGRTALTSSSTTTSTFIGGAAAGVPMGLVAELGLQCQVGGEAEPLVDSDDVEEEEEELLVHGGGSMCAAGDPGCS
jgi:hypothetical protein